MRKEIYERKILNKDKTDNFFTLEKGVAKMRHELFAFFFECGSGYKVVSDTFTENEKCGITEIKYLQNVDAYNCMQKNSTFKEFIKVG